MSYKFPRTEALLNSFGNTLISRYREKIKEYASGKLYNTINFEITKGSSNYIVTINLEEYWKNISYGRKPGSRMPPIEAIKNWIEYKKILPRPIQLKSGKTVLPSTEQLAFVIARSIGKNGIEARPIARETVDQLNNEFIGDIKASIQRDIMSIIES